MGRRRGQVVVVTGGGGGLGRGLADRFGRLGATVVCLDVELATARQAADLVDEAGGEGIALACDVSDTVQVEAAVDATLDEVGRLDVLVNAAGVAMSATATGTTVADWQRGMDANLTGSFLMCRAALPALMDGGGAIVNVASIAGLRGWPYMAAYSAAKGGLIAFTRSLAVEYAHHGVRVNAVAPGSIDTAMSATLSPSTDSDPRLLGRNRALVEPAAASPDEIAAAIVFLASPESRFTTGSVFVVDGGATA